MKLGYSLTSMILLLASCADNGFRSSGKAGAPIPGKEEDGKKKDKIKIECSVAEALPSTPVKLKEKFNWKATGATAEYNQVLAAPTVAKLHASDKASTIFTVAYKNQDYRFQGALAYAIDHNGQQRWVSDELFHAAASLAIANVTGDSSQEIFGIGPDYRIKALNSAGKLLWTGPSLYPHFGPSNWLMHNVVGPSLGDVDGDGKTEVMMGQYVLDAATGTSKFELQPYDADIKQHGINSFADTTFATDVEFDGITDIVSGMGVFHGKNGELKCRFAPLIAGLGIAKMRINDGFQTVIGHSGDGRVIAFNGKNCEKIFEITKPSDGRGGGPINIADFDGDGELEFGLAVSKYYLAYETNGSEKWKQPTHDLTSAVTGSTAFDFNGDGKMEVIYNDENKLRVYQGVDGRVVYEEANTTGTLVEYPIVVDLDHDGHANLIVIANDKFPDSYYGNQPGITHGVRVFESPTNNWVATRTVWNQHFYAGFNISDDGSVNPDASLVTNWFAEAAKAYLVGFRNNPVKQRVLDTSECE